ncbi:MAG: DUF3298 domain-containing protein [Paludibacteraceae bacterium]|nr:DUF3298 domain-containing protein [Paludibacteraceae bacterium]
MTSEKSYSEIYYLAEDTSKGSFRVNLMIEIPVCYHNNVTLDGIRNTLFKQLFGQDYLSYGSDTVLNIFASSLINEYKITNEPLLDLLDSTAFYSFMNEHRLEGFSLLNDEHIYSYGINRYVFMGGAHGLTTLNYLNFDLKTGTQILEQDLFKDSFQLELTELIKSRIIEQSNEDPNIESIAALEETDYWVDAIKPNNNFYITDETVNYVFNPYEIAPYYMGITEVIIPFDRLKEMLKKPSVIDYLIYKETAK